ncbi:MacB-like periplasmic core domain protein [Leptospira yanagawae serovar Saopaulo str. Sao Paulo = ATCC 700523]|uniref:MacB-like periplasmic core domain protein n=1 Tax=Leptospira yanagawae serovar Saopaulo str. Sao Paulo = ATCC 700523 TaxID=1249483 RepID=A0A5E8HHW4_9LEPT|nr:MacB family efflux pump subunit [Leptospira yanagawae]EOQ90283.1 MacB-like periplasmic core domain protein [Leptospira yanagawae serovar Saopaulo str. Sao Paulo = ATCC 700523]
MLAIEIKNLSKSYQIGNSKFSVLNHINLEIKPGEFVAIMGPSGSGKSTLLQVMGLLDHADSGTYKLFGRNVENEFANVLSDIRGSMIGFVFQQFHLLAKTNALQNVSLPALYTDIQDSQLVAETQLKKVGLSNRFFHTPNELSGGQQQRVAIARALLNDPPIIFADEPTGNLDSKSKIEIMFELQRLHSDGKTIVMVTHEPEMAEYCDRIIHVSDGQIVREESKKKNKVIQTHFQNSLRRKTGWKLLKGILKQSLFSLTSNRLRTFLSALGILFGVVCVISVMALGEGAKKSVQEQFSSLGANLVIVRTGGMRSGGVSLEAGTVNRLDVYDVNAVQKKFPEVKQISAVVNGRAQLVFGNRNWNSFVTGAKSNYESLRNLEPIEGRFFTELEDEKRALVCLVGNTVVRELYEGKNPVGTYLKINRVSFRVIGQLPEKGSTGFRDQDDVVLVPLNTAMKRLLNKDAVDNLEMELDPNESSDDFIPSIKRFLHERHGTNESMGNIYQVMSMADIQSAVSETNQTMSTLLIALATVSLLVGGIGIMNIMLVSVKERTKEIGLRKALGARESDIRLQFLIESTLTSLTGGIVGLIFGILAVLFLQEYFGWTIVLSFPSIGFAFLFSITIGILFGWWPSEYAAKLSPIVALRSE